MNINLLEDWLKEFKNSINHWFEDEAAFVKRRYEKFPIFFDKVENSFDDFYKDFQEMCTWLHSLSTNNLALAKAQGRKSKNHTKEEYVNKLRFLLNTSIDVNERLDKALDTNSEYKIKYFGQSSLTELITYNEPNKFTFLNHRAIQAIQALEAENIIKSYLPKGKKGKSNGNYFKAFNHFIQSDVLEKYATIIYGKSSSEVDQKDLYSKTTLMLEIDQLFNWVYQRNKKNEVDSCFIDSITIKDFYSIKELELANLKTERFIFLLGENGSGKTVFLKALLIALKKAFIDKDADKGTTGIIDEILKDNPDFELWSIGVKDDTIEYEFNAQKDTKSLKNVYAYGTRRNKVSQTSAGEPYGFMTLFSEYNNDYELRNIEQWLMDVERKELKKIAKFTTKDVAKVIGQFLDINNFKIEIKENPITHVLFVVDNVPYSLKELSEGYQSVLLLIVDMLSRLIDNNPKVKNTKDFYGVVLIDELDLFLHPKWEKSICHKLNAVFPNIQFFITTHSPILIDGATKTPKTYNRRKKHDISDKITLIRLENKDGSTRKIIEYKGENIKYWNTNLLLNSIAFDEEYWDGYSKEDILKLRTEVNEKELLETYKKIKEVREETSEKMKKQFIELLQKH